MLQNILDWLKNLWDVVTRKTPAEQAQETKQQAQYEDVTELNVTAMAANKVANIVAEDATIEVVGDGPRAEYMRRTMQRLIDRLKLLAARAMGTGGVWLVPYTVGTELYADIIPQNRFAVVEQRGEVLTGAQYVADVQKIGEREYVRATYCALSENGNYTIQNKAITEGREVPLTAVPAWAEIEPSITIPGVKQMLMGFIKCPTDSKAGTNDLRGVPITYGQDKIVQVILAIFNEIPDEFRLKKVFVGAADGLFNSKGRLPEDRLYKRFEADGKIGDKSFWEVFSPDIRSASYFDGLDYLFGLLEKAIGVNKGILTDLTTADATATAIKRSTLDTFNLVDAMRDSIKAGFEQILYAFEVLATAYEFAPRGEPVALTFDWSYSLIEDGQEKWKQLMEAHGAGLLKPEKVLAWLLDISEKDALAELPDLADDTGQVGE